MVKANEKPLRFAALIRVSTERQERTGESLRTQRKECEWSVGQMGGALVGWYGGQEHATPGFEKREVDRLLQDAAKGKFNAVIVANADRWSRDNEKSISGLEILKKYKIRFFVGVSECDLFNPEHGLFLDMSAVFGKFQAAHQKRKSILNRIERARRGIPTSGKKPVGRIFDKEASEWAIIERIQAMYEDIAERYLAGEKLPALAKEHGINSSTLTKNLRERCGTEWTERFRADDLNIDVTVVHRIPRLLPEKTIKRVRERLTAKRTYLHGNPKHHYLLSGRVFCGCCEYAMSAETNRQGHSYYRHVHKEQRRKCRLNRGNWSIRADMLEESVVRKVFELMGNPAAIKRAVTAAIPDSEKLMKQKARLDAEQATINRARDRILELVIKEAITTTQAEKKLADLKTREDAVLLKLDKISDSLASSFGREQLEQLEIFLFRDEGSDGFVTLTVTDGCGDNYLGGNDVGSYLAMWESRSDVVELIKSAFGEPLDGKPAGAYITPAEDGYKVNLRGYLTGGSSAVCLAWTTHAPSHSAGISSSGR